jgi:hypothetical protein
VFRVDLRTAGLITGGFNTASPSIPPGVDITGSGIDNYLPTAKLGGGNYVLVYSYNGINYFCVRQVGLIRSAHGWLYPTSNAGGPFISGAITLQQAYAMDKKLDDGLPQSGTVTAVMPSHSGLYWANNPSPGSPFTPYTTATPGTSVTCYDNGNVGGATQQYSVAQNGGAGVNCALSFQFSKAFLHSVFRSRHNLHLLNHRRSSVRAVVELRVILADSPAYGCQRRACRAAKRSASSREDMLLNMM